MVEQKRDIFTECHTIPDGLRNSRKRSRTKCQRNGIPSFILTIAVFAGAAILSPVRAFPVKCRERMGESLLEAVRSPPPETAQPIEPRSSTSREKREAAVMAMKRQQVESALDGVDAQMLELLSDQFLYPTSDLSSSTRSKPRGRPDFVPGAMRQETMAKFQEKKEMIRQVSSKETSIIDASGRECGEVQDDSVSSVAKKSSGKKQKVRGSKPSSETDLPSKASPAIKRRKRVVKNLPEPKDRSKKSNQRRRALKGRAKANNLELQKYYRTELLSPDEEYSLGVKVQLMVKCEQVHEGLAIHIMRLPTIEEWANACG